MEICGLCGCKTNEFDMLKVQIGEGEQKICTFCKQQLDAFGEGKKPGTANIKWLDAVMEKEVSVRNENVLPYLKKLREGCDTPKAKESSFPEAPAYNEEKIPEAKAPQGDNPDVRALLRRIEILEKELKALKYRQMIKTILELSIPIVMFIIILIVFFASGLFDALSGLMDLTDMM